MLKGAAAGSGVLVLGGTLAAAAVAPAAAEPAVGPAGRPVSGDLAEAAFGAVRPNRRDAVVTAAGFDHDVVISWGDRVVAGAPDFDVRRQSPEAAKQQFGYNCDYVGVLPLRDAKRDRKDRSLLVVNHEYTPTRR